MTELSKPIYEVPESEWQFMEEPTSYMFPMKGPIAKEVKAWCKKQDVLVWDDADSADGIRFTRFNCMGELTDEQKVEFKLKFGELIG